ncbi:MAG: MATE family efflux transporter [Oscillospiraceae bacterium]|nr:MATE family efflux transporter [Oscillospiraceae bacterium]
MEDKNALGTAPVGRLMAKLAVPAVAAQLINALYNIVDRMYIGHMADAGDLALTGLGVAFPVIMFISALSSLAGMGGGSRAAIRMGEKDIDGAEAILGGCTALLLVMAVAATLLFQIFKEPLLLLFGASENTLPYASGYLGIYLWGTVSVLLALGLNNFVTTQGFATFSMLTVVIGAVCNIILDPIFIFGLQMGVQGAALATVLAQTVSALWVLFFLMGKRTLLKLRFQHLRLKASVLLPVIAIGVSPFIMQSTESLVSISFNSSLLKYGGDPYVGAMTIASSVMQVGTMPLHGLSQGAQPIIGFNYGAGKLDRVKQAFRLLFICCLTFTVAIWALVELFPEVFIAVFNDKPQLVTVATQTLRVYFAGIFMFGIQSACQQTFVALGEAKISLFLALLRKVILLIPLIFILPLFLPNKVFAVWLAEPVADICAAVTTGCMFAYRFPRILKRREQELGT